MELHLTPREAKILYISLQDFIDMSILDQILDKTSSIDRAEDLSLAHRLAFVLKESLSQKSKKST